MALIDRKLDERFLQALGELDRGTERDEVNRRMWSDLCELLEGYIAARVKAPALLQRLAALEEERDECKQAVLMHLEKAFEKFHKHYLKNPSASFSRWIKRVIKHRIIDFRRSHHAFQRNGRDGGGEWRTFVALLDDDHASAIERHDLRLDQITRVRKILTNHIAHMKDEEREALWRWMHGQCNQTKEVRSVLRRLRYFFQNNNGDEFRDV